MQRRKLVGLQPKAFEHPLDSWTLNALKNTAGFDRAIAKINEWRLERVWRIQLTGSYLRVTEDNFPELHAILCQACDTLDVTSPPELYIAPGNDVNASTTGTARPLIVLNSGAVDCLNDDELLFVMGHELGHIMCGHALYYRVAEFVPLVARYLGMATFGLGEALSLPVQAALLHWQRMSEYSCDRAGLLACQDASVAINAMIKTAGLPQKYADRINAEDFIKQAKMFREMDADALTRFGKYVAGMGASHPWTVARAHQFLEWIDGGGYEVVLNSPRMLPVTLGPGVKCFCTECGHALSGSEAFCPGCGNKQPQDSCVQS